jgi:hypothetical protein
VAGDILSILLQRDCTILKVSFDNNGISIITEKNLHITGGEKKGVQAIVLRNFRVPLAKSKIENHCCSHTL